MICLLCLRAVYTSDFRQIMSYDTVSCDIIGLKSLVETSSRNQLAVPICGNDSIVELVKFYDSRVRFLKQWSINSIYYVKALLASLVWIQGAMPINETLYLTSNPIVHYLVTLGVAYC